MGEEPEDAVSLHFTFERFKYPVFFLRFKITVCPSVPKKVFSLHILPICRNKYPNTEGAVEN